MTKSNLNHAAAPRKSSDIDDLVAQQQHEVSADCGPTKNSVPFEKRKEDWLRQVFSNPKYSQRAKIVATVISWHLNRNTWEAWPSYSTLARLTCLSPRTCKRAVKELAAGRDLSVQRRSVGGKKNLPNRYRPVLRSAGQRCRVTDDADAPEMTPGSVTADTRVVSPLTPKPLNEPPKEPLPYGSDLASLHTRKAKEKRVADEERKAPRPSSATSKPSLAARCYGEFRGQWPDRSPALVRRALDYGPAEEVLEDIREAAETGNDPGHQLWRPQ